MLVTVLTAACKGGLVIGGLAFVVGLTFLPGDRDLSELAHRLDTAGAATAAHDAEVWHACTRKSCNDSDHVRAVVELPAGAHRVLLHGSFSTTDGLPEEEWSPATTETGYAGTVDVLFDPTSPDDSVMATADVRAWVDGDAKNTVTEDCIITFGGAAVAVVSGIGLMLLLDYRPWRRRPAGTHEAVVNGRRQRWR